MRLVHKHALVGYQTPGQRPGCRNCAHFEEVRHDSPIIGPRQACTKHGLEVTSGGICNDHKLQRRSDESQLAFQRRQMDLLQAHADDHARAPHAGEPGDLVVTPARYSAMLALVPRARA